MSNLDNITNEISVLNDNCNVLSAINNKNNIVSSEIDMLTDSIEDLNT